MAVKTENRRVADWLKDQKDDRGSIVNNLILAGSGSERVLTSGMVLGAKTVTGTGVTVVPSGNTGDGVNGAITVSSPAKAGRHILEVIDVAADKGTFTVDDPQGKIIGSGTVASAFSGGGLAFTLADGAADFVVGDRLFLDIVITATKLIQQVLAASDGSEIPYGLLLLDTTAPDGTDKAAAIVVRDATINKAMITHPSGATAAQIAVALSKLAEFNIISREGV